MSHSSLNQDKVAFHANSRKIVCVGRNFADHAKELGNAVPETPILFLKPPSSIITEESGQKIQVPPGCTNLHHEIEVGVVIGKRGRDIPEEEADQYIKSYFLSLDMTARELQSQAKAKGLPWSVAKGYDTFCPVSDEVSRDLVPDNSQLRLWLKVNDEIKQDGTTDLMLFPVSRLISYISSIYTLEPNDLILTGTPAGVGPVKPGDVITAGLDDLVSGNNLVGFTFGVEDRPTASQEKL